MNFPDAVVRLTDYQKSYFQKTLGISESEVKNYLIGNNNGVYPLQKKYKEVKDSLNTALKYYKDLINN
jgi:predicted transcriptional regulator